MTEARLREQLRSLRHLPPNTWLPEVSAITDQWLATELKELPDATDPLRWLREARGPVMAQRTLSLALEFARRVCRDRHQVRADQHIWLTRIDPLLDDQQRLFGNLPRHSAQAEPFPSFPDQRTILSAPETLRSVLARLRVLAAVKGQPTFSLASGSSGIDTLLADLLRLPETLDPIGWLIQERAVLSARLTLTYLLDQCLPPDSRILGGRQTRRTLRPAARLHGGRGMSISVEQILFHEDGFVIQLRARLAPWGVRRPATVAAAPIWWEGFDRVVDDQGYQYLMWILQARVSNQLWWWNEHLTLVCYPALQTPVQELTFQAQPVVLTTPSGTAPASDVSAGSLPPLGSFNWRVRVPPISA